MRVWEGKQGVGFLLQGGLLWSQLDQLQWQNKAKYYFFLIRYITDKVKSVPDGFVENRIYFPNLAVTKVKEKKNFTFALAWYKWT